MPLEIPNLDDKTFDQIVAEARALIPQNTSEWTDHNIHDPGITFIELFGWLAEMQNYRLNQVTDRNYQKFFKLVGLSQLNLKPAQVNIVLNLVGLDSGFLVAARTRILPAGKEEFVFVTREDYLLTNNVLKTVLSRQDSKTVNHTKANAAANIYFAPFGEGEQPHASLLLEFDHWFAEPEFHLTFRLFEEDLDPVGGHADERAQVTSSIELKWEYLAAGKWQPFNTENIKGIKKDTTNHLTQSGQIFFRKPTTPAAQQEQKLYDDAQQKGRKPPSSWLRCRVEKGQYEIPPRLISIETNVVSAVQIESVNNEALGNGLGVPDQQVKLKKLPLFIEDSTEEVELKVGDILEWKAFVAALTDPKRTKSVEKFSANLGEEIQREKLLELLKKLNSGCMQHDPKVDKNKLEVISGLDRLLDNKELFDRQAACPIPDDCQPLVERPVEKLSKYEVRKLNRLLFERTFAGLVTSGRPQIQTGIPPDWENWHEVRSLENSGPEDRHYTLDLKEGVVTFGNGLNGRAPQEREEIRALFYRHSRGYQGNLTAGQTWKGQTDSGRSFQGQNRQAAEGGRDAESIDDARTRARRSFHEPFRTVTSGDYRSLALATPGLRVARADVIANHHPDFQRLKIPGNVTVVVVPSGRKKEGPGTRKPPEAGEGFITAVQRHLDSHRLITTEVHVIRPKYVPISVAFTIYLSKRSDPEVVENRVRKALDNFLDPIRGGPVGHKGWPLGRTVFPSEIYQLIDKQEGVDYVSGVSINGQKVNSKLDLQRYDLPYSGAHTIKKVLFEERGGRPGGSAKSGKADCPSVHGECRDC